MLATTGYGNRYTKSRIYDDYWLDNHSIRIPWLNFLTAQPIPEETDVIDCPKRNHTASSCSSLSSEDCFIVLEVQRPHSIIIEQELKIAQINEDEHHIEYEQLAQSMIIETPSKENAIEHQTEQNEEYAKVTQIHFHENSPNITKEEINEISITASSQQSCSITSLDSIENDSHISNSIQTTTFTFDCIKEQNIKQSILPFYLDNKSNNFSKRSSFLRLVNKRRQTIKSEYDLYNNEIKTNEPSLLQMKYLDGRPTLTDLNALESFQKSQLLSNSIHFRIDLLKNSSTQNLSYGKRILNRVQNFFKSTSPWQQKTIFERLNERKDKINHC